MVDGAVSTSAPIHAQVDFKGKICSSLQFLGKHYENMPPGQGRQPPGVNSFFKCINFTEIFKVVKMRNFSRIFFFFA